MATFRLRHFSSPNVLRAVARERLLGFLRPFRGFFAGRRYELPAAESDEEIEYSV